MANCKGCLYEGNIRYNYIEGNLVLPDLSKEQKDLFDKAIKTNTQCAYSERVRADGKMKCIQTCGPKELIASDVASLTLKSFVVRREKESMEYLQTNSVDWDAPDPKK